MQHHRFRLFAGGLLHKPCKELWHIIEKRVAVAKKKYLHGIAPLYIALP